MKKIKIFLPILILLFFSTIEKTQAVALFPGETISGYREYIRAFYQFSIPVALLIATVLIMIGGVIWITSAGNQTRISKAQEFIIQPLIGIVLLAGAYTLLALINPNLVDLRLQIETLSNIEGGSCRIVDPSTYSDLPEGEKTQRCFSSCSTVRDAQDCENYATEKKSETHIYESGSCTEACIQDKDAAIRCADITPFRAGSVADCNQGCFGSPRHASETGQGCYGASLSPQGMCSCGIGQPLEVTPEQQAREDKVKEARINLVADPYQAAARSCSAQSAEVGEAQDQSFSDGEDSWLDNCQDWCESATGFEGIGPEGTEVDLDCDAIDNDSRCVDVRPGTFFGTTCYKAFCACALD